MEYKHHPLSTVFPLMGTVDINELAADIQGHGLREPIVLFDGMVLDGRNRLRACGIVSVEPRFRDFNGDGDPLDFVVSVNMKRRHLTASQRGMIAAKITDLERGRRKTNPPRGGISEKEAAAKMSVGERTVSRAKEILRAAPQKIIEAVESGTKTVTTAVREIKQKEKPTLDKVGYPIPKSVLSDWREAEAFDDILKSVHRIKLKIQKALENQELPFREITNSTVSDLTNIWSDLQRVIPYAVCPTCQGVNRKNCTLCKQRGFLSKFGYDHWVPKETRELREKAV